MRNPLLELQTMIVDSQKESGLVRLVKDGVAQVVSASGTRYLPFDVPVIAGDQVTVVSGRVVSKQSLGEGQLYYV